MKNHPIDIPINIGLVSNVGIESYRPTMSILVPYDLKDLVLSTIPKDASFIGTNKQLV